MILVFGKNGQVAQALQNDLVDGAAEFLSSEEANFLDPQEIVKILNQKRPQMVINASAYTLVDKAESEKSIAFQINATTVGEIAQWCMQNNIPFVHFSTDYVFDGSGMNPLTEATQTNPVNFYGQTKLEGEKLVQKAGGQYYIFRVSWVYAPWGKNFPKTILRLAQEREEISIVNDQFGSPTDAREISAFVKLLISPAGNKISLDPGIYHLSFKPYMTWYKMAEMTVKEAQEKGLPVKVKAIHPISTDQFPTPAKRPSNSRLKTQYPQIQALVDKVKAIAIEKGWGYLG
ncbi:MAG: dTDP-4-dehydrorhamnose reductase [Bdellovibrionaceae bacterium]|nr:dTDP-4-dehydrorhamnose reductase [Pseudobdellovibrionaceae bacterium]